MSESRVRRRTVRSIPDGRKANFKLRLLGLRKLIVYGSSIHLPFCLLWLDLDDCLHFHRNVNGQCIGSNSRSSMVSYWLPKDFHNKIRASVHYQMLLLKFVGRLDNTKHLMKGEEA
jgi:hypothetical protein